VGSNGTAVSDESIGGFVGAGAEQEIREKRKRDAARIRTVVICCMGDILTDIVSTILDPARRETMEHPFLNENTTRQVPAPDMSNTASKSRAVKMK
jgi:hypothetical protein